MTDKLSGEVAAANTRAETAAAQRTNMEKQLQKLEAAHAKLQAAHKDSTEALDKAQYGLRN